MPTDIADHYGVLGLDYDCDHFDISVAYSKLIDKVTDIDRVKKIQTAWEVLNDLDSRQKYDEECLWVLKDQLYEADKEKRAEAHRENSLAESQSPSPDRHPLHRLHESIKFKHTEQRLRMAHRRKRLEHNWSRTKSDTDRIRLLGAGNQIAMDIFRYVKTLVRVANVNFDELDRQNTGRPSNREDRTEDMEMLLQVSRQIRDDCRNMVHKLTCGNQDRRPVLTVLGERHANPQAWKLSKELANVRSLDQHMAYMQVYLDLLCEYWGNLHSLITTYQLKLI